jgi:ribosome-associated protein
MRFISLSFIFPIYRNLLNLELSSFDRHGPSTLGNSAIGQSLDLRGPKSTVAQSIDQARNPLAKRVRKSEPARKFAIRAARLAQDGNCEQIVVLDLRGVSPVTDYFVIATGSSDRQMRSVADDVVEHGKGVGQNVWRQAGLAAADWIVLDFVDVVVHLFDGEHRRYYDLEMLWGDVPHVRWQRRKTTPKDTEAEQ